MQIWHKNDNKYPKTTTNFCFKLIKIHFFFNILLYFTLTFYINLSKLTNYSKYNIKSQQMSIKYEIKKLQIFVLWIYQSLQITQKSKSLHSTIKAHLML
jgi:hypothetical protein